MYNMLVVKYTRHIRSNFFLNFESLYMHMTQYIIHGFFLMRMCQKKMNFPEDFMVIL